MPLTFPVSGLGITLIATAALAIAYLAGGFAHDVLRRRHLQAAESAAVDLAVVLFGDEIAAGVSAEALAKAPKTMLLDMVQRLAVDLDGESDDRLRKLVSATGHGRPIRRRLQSRSWRRRAQGAALASLLPQDDPLRVMLLRDPHPMVRARAAESLEKTDVVANAGRLIELLSDDVDAVKFAAQQSLLRADARIVPNLCTYLTEETGAGLDWALDVAANIPDARLVPALETHCHSPDPRRRSLAIAAIAPWLDDLGPLADALADESALVRATAAESVGAIRAQTLAAKVGRMLADQTWTVRREAGLALGAMGPAGLMTLRIHLDDADPYAQDMARQILDTVTLSRRSVAKVA